ncbi:cysteine-rich receptor-like protein kinase 10 [Castanea sativa]|uniref:cysteine-rich receptor-like protein kinase 10 n=1 Tax=Castanea sativa TaxID=21020 RepID=UPI003F64F172
MTSFNPFSLPILFFSILSLSFLSLTTHAADPVHLMDVCANNTFSANSIYQTNLKSLLSSLDSNTTRNIEFFNTTTGQNTSDPVYGLFNCRGDVTPQLCRDCVNAAVKVLTSKCSREKVALTYYDECIVRYSNRSFFSTVDEKPRLGLLNTQNVTDQDKFNRLLNTSMLELATETSDFPTGSKKFGTKQVNISAFQTLYNLAQCTPDLSSTDCKTCLQDAVKLLPWCCSGKQGGRIVFPSCNVRYELYPFYTLAATAPTPSPGVQSPPPPSPSSVSGPKDKSKLSTSKIIAIVAPISASVVLFIVGCCFLIRRGKKYNAVDGENAANDITTVESLQYNFVTIESATNKFSEDNKLGEGGFGQVYKGTLPNGQEIAVKRLSKSSGQGAEQFKNEVVVVAQLQHRNLARLLGFCLQGEEKILVYEFVPNKSLDYILYDPKKQGLLDWSRRYKIIGGIARGIQYLHEDSRLRIIHRDLKASNVLLDADMNPKISDFGMARIFGVDQTQGNTSRIVGTYGYMSPEYAMHGEFSVKSDVYSFGVLVLEIITGKKNSNFYESEVAEDLLSYVWIHWRDGRPLELLDPALGDSFSRDEVMRCIHIGLLCVQEDPADRPTMATIVLTLTSGSVSLQAPPQPAFFAKTDTNIPIKGLESSDQSTSKSMPWSVNEASITELDPR